MRDKWIELTGNMIPDTPPVWSQAFGMLDRTRRMSNPPPKSVTGYRYPDPGLVIFSDGRRERNLFNWLLVRDAATRRAVNDASTTRGIPLGVSNELWRLYIGTDFIDGFDRVASPAPAAKSSRQHDKNYSNSNRRQVLIDIFGRPPDSHNIREVEWQGHVIQWGTICEHDDLLVKEIMWDLHQSSFRFDLIALDRYLAPDCWVRGSSHRYDLICKIFGSNEPLAVLPLPSRDFGLLSADPLEKGMAYDALSSLMSDWPVVADECNAIDGPNLERTTAIAYCNIFGKTFGRPPILPKFVPRSSGCRGRYPYKRSD